MKWIFDVLGNKQMKRDMRSEKMARALAELLSDTENRALRSMAPRTSLLLSMYSWSESACLRQSGHKASTYAWTTGALSTGDAVADTSAAPRGDDDDEYVATPAVAASATATSATAPRFRRGAVASAVGRRVCASSSVGAGAMMSGVGLARAAICTQKEE